MATVFKTFLNNDVATTRTLLNEAIPIDGKIMFGSYTEPPVVGTSSNIKTFPHEMFQSVYDYPFLKSSSNHIFDITLGYSSATLLDTDAVTFPNGAQAKKKALYNQFAQIMVGHDKDGNILKFDEDGNILEGGDKYDEVYLLSVARLLNKDEMKKGSFYLCLDYAVTEPGQRLYTPVPSPVATAYPLASAPSLPFNDPGGPPNIPAGFFEYNAGTSAAIALEVTAGVFAEGTDPQLAINSIAVGGPDPGGGAFGVVYAFVSALTGVGVGDLSPFAVLVLRDVSTEITLQNLTNAINNTESLSAGDSGVTYDYGSNWIVDPNVAAVFDGVATVTISSVGAVDGTLISATYGLGAAITTEVGTLGAASFSGLDGGGGNPTTPTAGPVNLSLAADSLINSDDYRRISMIITDEGAQNDYRVNSPAGDYGILKIKEYKIEKWDAVTGLISDVCVVDAAALETAAIAATGGSDTSKTNITLGGDQIPFDRKIGLVYYQAGVITTTPYAFEVFGDNATAPREWSDLVAGIDADSPSGSINGKILDKKLWDAAIVNLTTPNTWSTCTTGSIIADLETFGEYPGATTDSNLRTVMTDTLSVKAAWEQVGIDSSTGGNSNATGFRRRMCKMSFNNTTELNSTIYFARLNNNEFNYSANPTYLNESKIRVKETTLDAPVSYITSVGLYSADNELLAQAKLSEPVRKDPTNEFVLRTRLDW